MSTSKPVAAICPQCGANLPPGTEETVVCLYCGSRVVWNQAAPPAASATRAAPVPSGQAARGMRFKLFTMNDPQGTGLELFRMLVPSSWQVQGGCRWLLDNPGMPAVISVQVWNPDGAEAFEILPNMNFVWNSNAMTGMMFPPGSRYFGAEVQQPVSIQDAMQHYVLPRYRGSVQNLRLNALTPVADLPRLAKSEAPLTPGGSAEGAKARICYQWQGRAYEEEIYGVVEVFRTMIGGMFGQSEFITWFIDFLFSFRGAEGKLDAQADVFSAMIQSFKLNPQWYAAFKTIAQQLIQNQIQRIHHIGQIGQILASAGSQMREENLNGWYQRQEIYDRMATDRSRQIRDVDGFYDPHREEVVELPSGYGYAWANDLGEYILTEDPNFNPNLESGQHWEPMQLQSG